MYVCVYVCMYVCMYACRRIAWITAPWGGLLEKRSIYVSFWTLGKMIRTLGKMIKTFGKMVKCMKFGITLVTV